MRLSKYKGMLIAGFLFSLAIPPVLAGTYYTHYTNAGCQVTLTLSTNQISSGGTLGFTAVASGYLSGYTTGGPSLTHG